MRRRYRHQTVNHSRHFVDPMTGKQYLLSLLIWAKLFNHLLLRYMYESRGELLVPLQAEDQMDARMCLIYSREPHGGVYVET